MLFTDLATTSSNGFIFIFDSWETTLKSKSNRIFEESIPFLGLGTLGSGWHRQTSPIGDSPCNKAGPSSDSVGIEGVRTC